MKSSNSSPRRVFTPTWVSDALVTPTYWKVSFTPNGRTPVHRGYDTRYDGKMRKTSLSDLKKMSRLSGLSYVDGKVG